MGEAAFARSLERARPLPSGAALFRHPYPYCADTEVPSKVSVTGLAGHEVRLTEAPDFLLEARMTPADRGTAYHALMQRIPLRAHDAQSVQAEIARLVGTEGTLGVTADVKDVSGIWKELTDNVNQMASNLTIQVRDIAEVTTAVANGDLTRKITVEVRGELLQLKNTINTMVDQLGSFASEVTRVAREVGTEGKLGGQAAVPDVAGTWKDLTDNVNSMASNLTAQVRNIAEVTTAVANGDLSKKITVDVSGEILQLKEGWLKLLTNTMDILIAMSLGSLIIGLALATVAYYITKAGVRKYHVYRMNHPRRRLRPFQRLKSDR